MWDGFNMRLAAMHSASGARYTGSRTPAEIRKAHVLHLDQQWPLERGGRRKRDGDGGLSTP